MDLGSLSCPGCSSKLRVSRDLSAGDPVRCPRCDRTFAVPADAVPPPLTTPPDPGIPAYSVRRVVEEMERRLGAGEGATDEETADFLWRTPSKKRSRPKPFVETLEPTYTVSVHYWFGVASKNWGAMMPLFTVFGMVLVMMGVVAGFGIAEAPFFVLLVPFVLTPLLQGPMAVALDQLQHKRWSFGTFFAGFSRMGTFLGFYFLSGTLAMILSWFAMVACFILSLVGDLERLGRKLLGSDVEYVPFVVMAVVSLAVYTRVGSFGPQLIFHKGCTAGDAIHGSWSLSRGRFWRLFGFQLMLVTLNGLGACLGGFGLLFTLPFTQLASAAAYLHAIGELTERPSGG